MAINVEDRALADGAQPVRVGDLAGDPAAIMSCKAVFGRKLTPALFCRTVGKTGNNPGLAKRQAANLIDRGEALVRRTLWSGHNEGQALLADDHCYWPICLY
ncbi:MULTISPECIES: hypothetical protein [Sphingomonas]|jgi:hypothetical protein|nr:hypothetical protein [Sphingomonas turrisvirgatae]